MSFLPYSKANSPVWYGAMGLSTFGHVAVGTFLFLSGGALFLTPAQELANDEGDFEVTLQILDAEVIDEVQEPIDDRIPEDAEPLDLEDTLDALAPEDTTEDAISPDLTEPEVAEVVEPEVSGPEVVEPEVSEPAVVEPEVSEPEVVEPEVSEPEVVEPEVSEPEAVEPEPTEPEVVEPEVSEPEVSEPEVVEPEVTEPEIVEPEPTEPDTLTQEPILIPEIAEPEVTEPEPTEPEIAQPLVVEPEVVAPQTLAPETLAIADLSVIDDGFVNPLAEGGGGGGGDLPEDLPQDLPVDEEMALLELPDPAAPPVPEIVEPVAQPAPEPEVEVAPSEEATAPDVAEPDAGEPDVTDPDVSAPDVTEDDATPPAPQRQPVVNPSASDIAIGTLLRRIRATPEEICTLVLPRRAAGGVGLSLLGADDAVLDGIAAQVTEGLADAPIESREIIDPRQCATLDVVRQAESYPASRIGLALDKTVLESGDILSGRVLGGEGLFLTLLLVDDNGVVQDMGPFTTLDGNVPRFEAPIARSGETRDTRQIVLALGTRGAPLDLGGRLGQLAQDVFGPIDAEVLDSMVFGIATVDVR